MAITCRSPTPRFHRASSSTSPPIRIAARCFEVGIGFDNEVSIAQELALAVLNRHAAVLKEPEALVLVDRLGSATVNLKLYLGKMTGRSTTG